MGCASPVSLVRRTSRTAERALPRKLFSSPAAGSFAPGFSSSGDRCPTRGQDARLQLGDGYQRSKGAPSRPSSVRAWQKWQQGRRSSRTRSQIAQSKVMHASTDAFVLAWVWRGRNQLRVRRGPGRGETFQPSQTSPRRKATRRQRQTTNNICLDINNTLD